LRAIFTFLLASAALFQVTFFCATAKADNHLAGETGGVFPHPDNIHAFVTIRNDNSMLIINLETGETLHRVEVQSSPDGVAWSPVQR